MKKVLPSSHNSLETAYLQDWPYGRHRCIRAVWIETTKHGQRFCYATSKKYFTAIYEEWKKILEREVNHKNISYVFSNSIHERNFNKPKKATYNLLTIITHDDEIPKTEVRSLSYYSREENILSFTAEFTELLDEKQLILLRRFSAAAKYLDTIK